MAKYCLVVWHVLEYKGMQESNTSYIYILCKQLIYRLLERTRIIQKCKGCGQTDRSAISKMETTFYKLVI